jgi:hypothetical protein
MLHWSNNKRDKKRYSRLAVGAIFEVWKFLAGPQGLPSPGKLIVFRVRTKIMTLAGLTSPCQNVALVK